MKFFLPLFVVFGVLIHCAYADESQISENIYVSSSEVMIGQNGIFVNYQGTVIPLSKIAYDTQGIYFNLSDMASFPKVEAWICGVCHHPNLCCAKTCYKCGAKEGEKKK